MNATASTFQRTPEAIHPWEYGVGHAFVPTNRECISCDDIFVPDDQLQCFTCRQACRACHDLSDLEEVWVDGDHPFHGSNLFCGECDAEYYKEYERDILAVNLKARMNHPELKTV